MHVQSVKMTDMIQIGLQSQRYSVNNYITTPFHVKLAQSGKVSRRLTYMDQYQV